MMRVLAVVEGTSEELFLRRVVAQHLTSRGVYLTAMRVLRGRARGGGSSWQPWERQLRALLGKQPHKGVYVTTFLDLYRIPVDLPGYAPPTGNGVARAEQVLRALRSAFQDERFIPYVQVHEFEALLFSDLSALNRIEPEQFSDYHIRELASSVGHLAPEAINESDATAPSKRILRAFPTFDKIDHGLRAIEAIGLETLRAKCPRFSSWLSRLESLGTTQS